MKAYPLLLFTFFFLVLLSGSFAWWDASYTYRQLITITDNNPVGTTDLNNVVRMPVDTATLISGGKMESSCVDLKVIYNNVTSLDTNIVGCNNPDTNIWFMLNNTINGVDSSNYYMYYGNAQASAGTDANLTIPGMDKHGFGYTSKTGMDFFDNNTIGTWSGTTSYSTTRVDGSASADFNGSRGIVFGQGQWDFSSYSFTIEMWINSLWDLNSTNNATRGDNHCFFCYGNQTTLVQLRYDVDTCGGGIAFYTNNGTGTLCATQTFTHDNWYHIAAVFQYGLYKRIYVNGIQTAIGAAPIGENPTYVSSQYACVGADAANSLACVTDNAYSFKGQIDSFRVSSVARTRFPQNDINASTIHPTTSLGSEEDQSYLNVAFSNTAQDILDPDNSVTSTTIDLNDTTLYLSEATQHWTWIISDANYSYDQNTTKTFTSPGDYNTCLFVYLEDLNHGTYCKNIEIQEYPQDLNFTWTEGPSVSIPIDFNASVTDDENITTWAWDFGDQSASSDQNATHTFVVGGNKNVCLTVTDYDTLTKQLCATVNIGGAITLRFSDENTHAILTPNVLFNNISYDVNSNGTLAIGMGGLTTGTYQVIAWDTNYSTRIWEWDLNSGSVEDYNLVMLKDQIGQAQDVNFLFYDENGLNVIASSFIDVYIGTGLDKNYSGRRKTNTSGETYFYLNAADSNYTFVVGNLEYVPVDVTVLRPKDEVTKAILGTHDLDFWNIYTDTRSSLSANTQLFMFPNTYGCQNIDVNSSGYYSRTYCLKEKGNPKTKTFQPYLVNVNDSILAWFYVLNKTTRDVLPDVLIRVYKTISGEGRVEVQSNETDSSGSTTLNFITLDPYDLEFYYENALVYSANLNPNTTTFYVYLDVEGIVPTEPVSYGVDATFYPTDNPIEPDDSNNLNFYINVECLWGTAVESVSLELNQWDVNLTPANHVDTDVECGANSQTITISYADMNGNYPLHGTATIRYTNGTIVRQHEWFVEETVGYGLLADLATVQAEMLGGFGGALIAVLISIVVAGFVMKATPLSYGAVSIIVCAVLGFFAYIGWIPILIFGVSCLFAAAGFLLMMRRA